MSGFIQLLAFILQACWDGSCFPILLDLISILLKGIFIIAVLFFIFCILAGWANTSNESTDESTHDSLDALQELVDLCGSRVIAKRLVSGIQYNNPNRSFRWCCDKAIWDLKRDRY
jgi:hypothetical protein